MQIHWPSILFSLSTFILAVSAAHAAESVSPPAAQRVKLVVSASESIAASVRSCLTQELGKLDHARLVDGEAEWEIAVLALEIRSTRGYRGGVAISAVMLPRYPNEQLAPLLVPDARQQGLTQTANLWKRPGHYLQVDALDRLPVLCQQIASDFASRHLSRNLKSPELANPLQEPSVERQ